MSVLRKKSIETIHAQGGDDDGHGATGGGRLTRNLTSLDLIGFGIGIVIGTGIFTLTGLQAKENAGPAIVISFLIAGFVSLLAALCYAELASAVPAPEARTPTRTRRSARSSPGSSPGTWCWSSRSGQRWWPAAGRATCSGVPVPAERRSSARTRWSTWGRCSSCWCSARSPSRASSESAWVTNTLVIIKVSVCLFVIVVGRVLRPEGQSGPVHPADASRCRPTRPPARSPRRSGRC